MKDVIYIVNTSYVRDLYISLHIIDLAVGVVVSQVGIVHKFMG